MLVAKMHGVNMKVLLIEDNMLLAKQVAEYLETHGCIVDHTIKGRQGIRLATSETFDVVIVDLMLPDVDGFDVAEAIKNRATVNLPILMLTARDAIEDKAKGFASGADDYLTKPFALQELLLRCQSLSRRQELFRSKTLTLGDLELNTASRVVTRGERSIQLGQIPFTLLQLLMEAFPQPVTRAHMIHTVWQDEPPDTDALKSHIYQLRQALNKGSEHNMLHTVTNLGYRLSLPDDHDN